MMANEGISEYIEALRLKQSERTEITADKVIQELAAIAFSDRTRLAKIDNRGYVRLTPTDELSSDEKKTISGIKEGKFGTEVSTYDKVRALELLGKHLGIFEKRDGKGKQEDPELPKLYSALTEDENDI